MNTNPVGKSAYQHLVDTAASNMAKCFVYDPLPRFRFHSRYVFGKNYSP